MIFTYLFNGDLANEEEVFKVLRKSLGMWVSPVITSSFRFIICTQSTKFPISIETKIHIFKCGNAKMHYLQNYHFLFSLKWPDAFSKYTLTLVYLKHWLLKFEKMNLKMSFKQEGELLGGKENAKFSEIYYGLHMRCRTPPLRGMLVFSPGA